MFLGSYKKSETTSDSKLVPRILGSGLRFTLRHHEGTEPKNFACVVTNRFLPGRKDLTKKSYQVLFLNYTHL